MIDETWGQPDWGYRNGGLKGALSTCEETGATWLPGPLSLLPLHRAAALVRVQGWLAGTPGTESGPEGVQYKPQYTVAEGEGLWGRCGVEEGETNVEAV